MDTEVVPENWADAALRKVEGMKVYVVFLIVYLTSEASTLIMRVLLLPSVFDTSGVVALGTSARTPCKMPQVAVRR